MARGDELLSAPQARRGDELFGQAGGGLLAPGASRPGVVEKAGHFLFGAPPEPEPAPTGLLRDPSTPLSSDRRIRRMQIAQRKQLAENEAQWLRDQIKAEGWGEVAGVLASLPFGGPITPQGVITKQALKQFVIRRALAGAAGGAVGGGTVAGVAGRPVAPSLAAGAAFGAVAGGAFGAGEAAVARELAKPATSALGRLLKRPLGPARTSTGTALKAVTEATAKDTPLDRYLVELKVEHPAAPARAQGLEPLGAGVGERPPGGLAPEPGVIGEFQAGREVTPPAITSRELLGQRLFPEIELPGGGPRPGQVVVPGARLAAGPLVERPPGGPGVQPRALDESIIGQGPPGSEFRLGGTGESPQFQPVAPPGGLERMPKFRAPSPGMLRRRMAAEFAARTGLTKAQVAKISGDQPPSLDEVRTLMRDHGVTPDQIATYRTSLPKGSAELAEKRAGGLPQAASEKPPPGAGELERFTPFVPPKRPTPKRVAQKRVAVARATGDPEVGRAILLAENAGYSRDERLAVAAAELGRPVKSFSSFTPDEARRVADKFAQLGNPATAGPAIEGSILANTANMVQQMERRPMDEVLGEAARRWHAVVTAGTSYWRRLGPAGAQVADGAEIARNATLRRLAAAKELLRESFRGISEQDDRAVTAVLEGGPPPSERIARLAETLRAAYREYRETAEQLGVRTKHADGTLNWFHGLDNYSPRYYTKRSLARLDPIRRAQVMQYIQATGRVREFRTGNLNFAREVDLPGYETRASRVFAMYVDNVAPRIEQARVFGGRDELAHQLFAQIERDFGPQRARQAARIFLHWADPKMRERSPIANISRAIAAPLFLTYAGVLQPTQLLFNTFAREGAVNLARGVAKIMLSPAARREARLSGAAVRSVLDEITATGKIAEWHSRLIGLSWGDKVNRLVSAVAAEGRARQVVAELARGKTTPKNLIDAKRLGLDVDLLRSQGWQMTTEQSREAMLRGAIETQFLSDALGTSLAAQTPLGSTLLLYKNFALHQGRFVKNLYVDAGHGHWGPLVRFLGALGLLGNFYGESIRRLRGDETIGEGSAIEEFGKNILALGMLGVPADAIESASNSPEAVLRFVAGPLFSESAHTISSVVRGTVAAAQGEDEPFAALQRQALKRTVRRVPVIGRELAEELSPRP